MGNWKRSCKLGRHDRNTEIRSRMGINTNLLDPVITGDIRISVKLVWTCPKNVK